MYDLTVYVTGPLTEKSLLDKILGREGKTIYLINPQFYSEGDPNPARNFGVFKHEVEGVETISSDGLESQIKSELDKRFDLGTGIQVGHLIIPPDRIKISYEFVDE